MTAKAEARKEQIFAVGAKLFAEKGYERTTLQEVADRLGVTKPALYYYLDSKQELLYEIMSFVMDSVLEQIIHIVESKKTPLGKLEALITSYIAFFTAHPDALTVMVLREDSLEPELRAKHLIRQKEYANHVKSIMKGVLAERGDTDVDATAATYALLGGMNWIFRWYDPKGRIPPKKLSRDFLKIFVPNAAADLNK